MVTHLVAIATFRIRCRRLSDTDDSYFCCRLFGWKEKTDCQPPKLTEFLFIDFDISPPGYVIVRVFFAPIHVCM